MFNNCIIIFPYKWGNKIRKFSINYISHWTWQTHGRAIVYGSVRSKKRKLNVQNQMCVLIMWIALVQFLVVHARVVFNTPVVFAGILSRREYVKRYCVIIILWYRPDIRVSFCFVVYKTLALRGPTSALESMRIRPKYGGRPTKPRAEFISRERVVQQSENNERFAEARTLIK